MSQSVSERIEYEQLDATLPRLPSYRKYNEVNSTSIETAQLNGGSDTPPAYKSTATNITKGSSPLWASLKKALRCHQEKSKRRSGWKPVTLRAPILGGFVLFSLAVIFLLEILAHISSGNGNKNGGGLAFAMDVDSLSPLATFGFLYLPTVIAVIYSMLWSWVDLDAKRLEPWFQLSKANGANAKDSLLLQYPFDFLPFIPLTAGRRKHWGVFLAGSIILVIFWVVTPFQSAIFNTGTVVRTSNLTMGTSGTLLPIENQTNALNANFLNTAYGVSWLSQQLPPFTTSEFAVLPFRPTIEDSGNLPTETWSAEADTYSTNLTCTPANVVQLPLGYTFDNGKGCSVSGVVLADTLGLGNYMINYIGYYSDPLLDWALQNPNCSSQFSNNFLALYATASSRVSTGIYSNLTAMFCEPSYHIQRAYVKVNASNEAVVSANKLDTEDLSAVSDVFNTTNFELILGVGVGTEDDTSDYPDSTVLEQYPRLQSYNITWPFSNMVGFAIALNPTPIEDLAEPAVLQEAFQRAHQLLFTAAFSTLTVPVSREQMQDRRTGIRHDTPGAIIMVRAISIVVEVAFGIIAVLTFLLWHFSHYRPSNLTGDPASIADIMALIRLDKRAAEDAFKDNGALTITILERRLADRSFHLCRQQGNNRDGGLIDILPNDSVTNNSGGRTSSGNGEDKPVPPVRPLELGTTVGVVFVLILLISLGVLTFLTLWSSKRNGITLPSDNSIVLSILENYLPTTFATLLEPIWVILNRHLCLLQPFEELRKGHAKSTDSIEVKYTSLPPQLVVLRAIKSRHFLLAAVCVIAVSTNILAVALSGLLFESSIVAGFPTSTSQTLLPSFNGTPIRSDGTGGPSITFSDHFYVAMSNLSENTSLPAWVDKDFFYLPFDLPQTPLKSNIGTPLQAQGFRGMTTGFGAEVTCSELTTGASNNTVQFDVSGGGQDIQFSTSSVFSNGSQVTCVHPRGPSHTANDTTNQINKFTGELSALEAVQTMQPASNTSDGGFCAAMMLVGWVRGQASSGAVDSTFLSCTQQLRIAQFEVTVGSDGRIVNSTRTSEYVENVKSHFTGNSTEIDLFQQSSTLITPVNVGDFVWHNDSVTSDYMNSLLEVLRAGSSSLVDPSSPVPKASEVGPMVEFLYRQLFAILLGLNTHVFSQPEVPTGLVVNVLAIESRLFVSRVMFLISVVVLSAHFIIAALLYTNRPRRFLPRMPTSIGSIIAYVTASRAVEEVEGVENPHHLIREHRYGYGRFIGTDGKTRVGIERQRYVIPLESKNPAVQKRKWTWQRQDEKQPQTWI